MTSPRDSDWYSTRPRIDVGDDHVALTAEPGEPNGVWFWHRCGAVHGMWRAVGLGNHSSSGPPESLTLVGSVLADCCGLHGFIRDGKWTDG